MQQIPINVGDPHYDPLFEYRFGLGYSAAGGATSVGVVR